MILKSPSCLLIIPNPQKKNKQKLNYTFPPPKIYKLQSFANFYFLLEIKTQKRKKTQKSVGANGCKYNKEKQPVSINI
jgi:hypothetical protein